MFKRCRRSDIDPFNFNEHCFIYGETCSPNPDPKNPSSWKRIVQCTTADRVSNQKSFKGVIFNACDMCNDGWAKKVRLQIEGAVSYSHAADAQYHKVCMSLFHSSRNIDRSKDDTKQHYEEFTMLFKLNIWPSIVHAYGTALNCKMYTITTREKI